MKEVFRGRELFALEALGVRVQGTCHLPDDEASGAQARRHDLKGTGILLISGLLSPRAAVGDSAVFWADSFAKRGLHLFPRRPARIVRLGRGCSCRTPEFH